MPDDLLFYGSDLRSLAQHQSMEVEREVEAYNEERLLNTPLGDLCSYFNEKYRIEPLALDEGGIQVDIEEARYDTTRDPRFFSFPGERSPQVPATRTVFFVPFTGQQGLFRCQPSQFTLSPPRGSVSGSELAVSFIDPVPDPIRTRQQFDAVLNDIRQYVGWVNTDVAGINAMLASLAKSRLEQRRQRLLQARASTAALGFALRRRPRMPTTYAAPLVRRKLSPAPPPASSAPFAPEPALPMEEYDQILEIIQNMVQVMERSPSAFSKMEEEHLRQHFLVQLNGHYEGTATGETFNMVGKTDILIREAGKNIFIAECKFWKGPAQFHETIDQLLSYLSWRDTKSAILLFCRNKDFSAVLKQIPDLLAKHPKYKRALAVAGDTRCRAVLAQADDPTREVTLTVASFHLPLSP